MSDQLDKSETFKYLDSRLDSARTGPLDLAREPVAQVVEKSIHSGADRLGHYDLSAYVIMPNHVHLLVRPRPARCRFLLSLKHYTAREANRVLGRTRAPFWQAESYDYWVRGDQEAKEIQRYIENNPVQAGLAARPEDYPWSSAKRAPLRAAS